MKRPKTINGLMKHMRKDCHISISGSLQKRQLVNYGFFHGYKGYRFYGSTDKQIPYTTFKEVISVIEYDSTVKSILYPELMYIETSVKNIVCNEAVQKLKDGTFDYVLRTRMNDNPTNTNLRLKRIKLRNSIYKIINDKYSKNQMLKHFYDRGEDPPLWVIFEILYLSDLALFFDSLNINVRENILSQMNMLEVSIDTNRELLSAALYTIKDLRNAVAHNGVIFDRRFSGRKTNQMIKKWIEGETGIYNISFYSLLDYIILICVILKKLDQNGKRAKELLKKYKVENIKLKNKLSMPIYSCIFQKNLDTKIAKLEQYLKTN